MTQSARLSAGGVQWLFGQCPIELLYFYDGASLNLSDSPEKPDSPELSDSQASRESSDSTKSPDFEFAHFTEVYFLQNLQLLFESIKAHRPFCIMCKTPPKCQRLFSQIIFKIFPRYFQNIFKIFPKCFQNIFKVFSKYFQNARDGFPRYCAVFCSSRLAACRRK